MKTNIAVALAASISLAAAQSSCSTTLTPTNSAKPSVASGYDMQLVATGLSKPRGIEFDTAGNLLVVEQGSGDLTALTLQNNGGCVVVSGSNTVISGQSVSTCGCLECDDTDWYYSSITDWLSPVMERQSMLPPPRPSGHGPTIRTRKPPQTSRPL